MTSTLPSARLVRRLVPAALALLGILASATPGSAATTAPSIDWPVQSLGDRGSDVLAIQHLVRGRLGSLNPLAPPATSRFDAATETAVRGFQASRSLAVTGIVDGTTWTALVPSIAAGASGEAVTALQGELVAKRGVSLTINGRFGAATRSAVLAFQRHMGLAVTGIVGSKTWRALIWHYRLPHFTSTTLCDYSAGNGPANWGTSEAIATLQSVGTTTFAAGSGRIAVGDISYEHGGPITGHVTHRRGLDLDIRPLRKANDQCSVAGTTWRSTAYDRTATRAMILAFRAASPGHIRVIWFNDPVLIREGLTRYHSGHDDHVHVRFCEAWHAIATYDC